VTRNRIKKRKVAAAKVAAAKEDKLGVTVGGPIPGHHFRVVEGQRHYFFPTPKDPSYSGAYYSLAAKISPLGERVAVFQMNRER
jgi:hypothetical protein